MSATIERLREFLRFDPETGRLYRLQAVRCGHVGQRADCMKPDGYYCTRIDGRLYLSHRVVFALHHGRWPEACLDHINCDPTDNRPENLRECDRAQNGRNRGKNRNNTSGFKGVTKFPGRPKPWVASIKVNRKRISLGYFETPEAAAEAYAAAARLYHGEFARVA